MSELGRQAVLVLSNFNKGTIQTKLNIRGKHAVIAELLVKASIHTSIDLFASMGDSFYSEVGQQARSSLSCPEVG